VIILLPVIVDFVGDCSVAFSPSVILYFFEEKVEEGEVERECLAGSLPGLLGGVSMSVKSTKFCCCVVLDPIILTGGGFGVVGGVSSNKWMVPTDRR
jgi:hypothetical protein